MNRWIILAAWLVLNIGLLWVVLRYEPSPVPPPPAITVQPDKPKPIIRPRPYKPKTIVRRLDCSRVPAEAYYHPIPWVLRYAQDTYHLTPPQMALLQRCLQQGQPR